MRRRRVTRYSRRTSTRSNVRMRGPERILFIIGATLYLVGLFGGINLLAIPTTTAILLLALSGGLLLVITLTLIF